MKAFDWWDGLLVLGVVIAVAGLALVEPRVAMVVVGLLISGVALLHVGGKGRQ